MTNLSRRSILAGLLSAPVLAPAAVWGAVEAVKGAALARAGVCGEMSVYAGDYLFCVPETDFAAQPVWGTSNSLGTRGVPIDIDWNGHTGTVTQEDMGDGTVKVRVAVDMPDAGTLDGWTTESDTIAQTEAQPPDVLDEDARAFCAAV